VGIAPHALAVGDVNGIGCDREHESHDVSGENNAFATAPPMTFDSLSFLAFLVLIYISYWGVRTWRARKMLLLGGSYLFYGAWNPFFVLLLIATTGFDWFAARWMERVAERSRRRAILIASITVNLCALGFFKYAQFFADNAVALAKLVGIDFKPLALGIILPVGISFYTFESLSYVVDVYKKRVSASKSLLDYGLYTTFFPHLVAGPILRYGDFEPQCAMEKSWRSTPLGKGLALFVYGLALKVCLADLVFAPVVDQVFAAGASPSAIDIWLGASSFALQAYCDFGGYSLCAIGIAVMFGFRFPLNFDNPFGAVGMADLWTRWHMSLSSWLRDYLFKPLGGYRKGRLRGHLNLIFTFLLCGLWHGAAWTFVIWGGLNGLFQVLERVFRDHVWDFVRVKHRGARAAFALITFALFSVAAVFFRATSIGQATSMLVGMLGFGSTAYVDAVGSSERMVALAGGALVVGSHIVFADLRGWDWLDGWAVWRRAATVAVALAAVVFSPGLNPAFIYFQF
jgi:alginate O-acetyltransferase complex protein AlgI